ncbi:hypothetical protein IJG11_00440 [Candidatus Saccharibacteria bacterium]|nr:hypothetical protein [Candidatus Saccharibacteria bacterium]
MKEGKAKFENKGLIILLCVLVVAIVGLVVGIVLGNIARNDADDSLVEKEWSENVACFEDGTVYDISVCVNEIYMSSEIDEDIDRDSLVVGLYNKAIDGALTIKDYNRARELLTSRSDFFVSYDNCTMATELLNDGRSDGLEGYDRGVFYSYALGLGMDCGDEESIALWENALMEYNGGVSDGFGF